MIVNQNTMTRRKTVSVIMPIRNEAAFVRTSLGTVLAQDYPEELVEVIVADGLSTDGTAEIVRSIANGRPNLRLIENRGLIVSTGLNAALALAKGDIVIRVDGHCKVAPDYISRCVDHLEKEGVDGVGGPIVTVGQTRIARVIAAAMSSPFGVGGSAFRTIRDRTMIVDTVPFAAYTRAIITQAGLYDEELVRNQDDEYNYRLRKLGAKLLLAADVRSEYYSRGSLRTLWRQYFQYGYWKVRVMQKHPRQMSRAAIHPSPVRSHALHCSTRSAYPGWTRALAARNCSGNLCGCEPVCRRSDFEKSRDVSTPLAAAGIWDHSFFVRARIPRRSREIPEEMGKIGANVVRVSKGESVKC